MQKLKGVKFLATIDGKDRASIDAAMDVVMSKLEAKFPLVVSEGRGGDKVSITIAMEQK